MSNTIGEHFPNSLFRGTRTYLHSTDIYMSALDAIESSGMKASGEVSLELRDRIDKKPVFLVKKSEDRAAHSAATFHFSNDDGHFVVELSETPESISASKAYDEHLIDDASSIEGRTASLVSRSALAPIETLTALAVRLHKEALPPPPGQRWMLARLKINRPLGQTETEKLKLEIQRVLAGNMTRTRIEGDGLSGEMIFILG